MTVTRADLAEAAYRATSEDVRLGDCERVVRDTFEAISDALAQGEVVKISKFASFHLLLRRDRMARNPKKPDEEHLVPEHLAVRFRATRELKNQVKQLQPAPRRRRQA